MRALSCWPDVCIHRRKTSCPFVTASNPAQSKKGRSSRCFLLPHLMQPLCGASKQVAQQNAMRGDVESKSKVQRQIRHTPTQTKPLSLIGTFNLFPSRHKIDHAFGTSMNSHTAFATSTQRTLLWLSNHEWWCWRRRWRIASYWFRLFFFFFRARVPPMRMINECKHCFVGATLYHTKLFSLC